MGSGSFTGQPTNYQQIRNKRLPTKDYEASARVGETTQYDDRGSVEIIKAKDVAELLKISTWMVFELVKRNEIPHFRVGRSVRFVMGKVIRWAVG